MNKKVLIAMSGGVDSSVAAFLIKEKDFDCVGATMRLYEKQNQLDKFDEKAFQASEIEDAKAVARRLGAEHYTLDFCDVFKEKVIDKFISVYENGGTPNPCIECNRYLKFACLLDSMKELGCDYIATGHYARIEQRDGWFYLKKAADISKDQSYVLYSLTQNQLSHVLLPLGEYTKSEIREIADAQGFANAHKKESQDICFVSDGDYAAFIESYTGKKYPPGNFVDTKGNVIGRHGGIIRYTNGQRKGLGVAFGCPMYVFDKNIKENTVTLCTNEELFSSELEAKEFNWLIPNPQPEIKCLAKVRYNMKEQPATAIRLENGNVRVIFESSQRAITRGQAVVLYDIENGDTVLGGGEII